MAELKSYSCPKCGSFLEVDRGKDVFDCPFCGNHFTVLDFHRDELCEEARKLAISGQKSKAIEKYEYLLSIEPDNFDLLYEYACVIDGIGAVKNQSINTNDPLNQHERLRTLLKEDPRFLQGEWAEYYKKLYETVQLSNDYHRLTKEHQELRDAAKRVMNEKITRPDYYNIVAALIGLAGFFVAFGISGRLSPYYARDDIRVFVPFIIYLVFLAGVIAFTVYLNIKADKAIKPKLQRQQEQYEELKAKSSALYENEVEPALEKYKKANKELKEIKPEIINQIEAKKLELSKKMDAQKPEKSGAAAISFVKTAPARKAAVCAKCGGDLTLDNENKLYVCSHCGVSFDYSTFVGAPGTKARREIMNSEFDLAEKRYLSVLEKDPGDFEANRGLILCAGKWRALPELRLNENLQNVDWAKLDERIKAAKDNSNHFNQEYFLAFEQLLEPVRAYFEAAEKFDADSPAAMKAAEQSFKFRYHNFVTMDKKYQLSYQDKTEFELFSEKTRQNLRISLDFKDFVVADKGYVEMLMTYPDDVESLRARILCAGRWRNPEEISLDQKMSNGFLDVINSRIRHAKDTASSEYSQYFETFDALARLLRENFVSRQNGCDQDKLKEIQDKFEELHGRLVEMDKELFDFS